MSFYLGWAILVAIFVALNWRIRRNDIKRICFHCSKPETADDPLEWWGPDLIHSKCYDEFMKERS